MSGVNDTFEIKRSTFWGVLMAGLAIVGLVIAAQRVESKCVTRGEFSIALQQLSDVNQKMDTLVLGRLDDLDKKMVKLLERDAGGAL